MYSDFINNITEQIQNYIKTKNINDSHEVSRLLRNMFDNITEKQNMDIKENMDSISSENAVIEVIDEQTGEMFRRYLELKYLENSNGLILEGENLKGENSKIVFISNSGIEKITELNGNGPNKPRCK